MLSPTADIGGYSQGEVGQTSAVYEKTTDIKKGATPCQSKTQ
jgi:hypothetical protein